MTMRQFKILTLVVFIKFKFFLLNDMPLSINELKRKLLSEIACCLLYQREGRVEPRELKRRTKPFKWLTRPRQDIIKELYLKCA